VGVGYGWDDDRYIPLVGLEIAIGRNMVAYFSAYVGTADHSLFK
jgi:hypothetical protein